MVWLTEPEVAEAYRARAARDEDDQARLHRLLADGLDQVGPDGLWLAVALVPALRGPPAPVDRALVADYSHWLRTTPRRGMRGTQLLRPSPARPAPHRVAFGSEVGAYVELHTDGVGLVAQRLWPPGTDAVHHRHGIAANVRLVVDEALVELVVAGLHLVCRHAVDHGDAGPDATAVCVLSDGGPRGHSGRGLAEPVVACRPRQVHGLEPLPGSRPVEGPALRSTATVHPAEVAADRRALLQATGRLANNLLQEFGWPELSQLTSDGGLRIEEFSPSTRPAVTRWARTAGPD